MLLLQSFWELPFFGCLAIDHGNNWTIFGDQDMDQKTCSKSPKLEIRPRHTEVEWSCCLVVSDRTKYFLVEYFAWVLFWGVLQYPQIPWNMCQCRRNELTSLSMLCCEIYKFWLCSNVCICNVPVCVCAASHIKLSCVPVSKWVFLLLQHEGCIQLFGQFLGKIGDSYLSYAYYNFHFVYFGYDSNLILF